MKKDNLLLILIIIWSFPNLSNSYELYKVLGWKFDVFDPSIFIDELLNGKMLERNGKSNNFEYKITDFGKIYIAENFNESVISRINYLSNDKEFLNILLIKIRNIIENYPER